MEKGNQKKAWIFAIAVGLVSPAALPSVGAEAENFIYQYKPPIEFKQPRQMSLLRPLSSKADKELMERKISAMAEALAVDFKLTDAHIKLSPDGETAVYFYGPHRFKAYPYAGMVKYSNRRLYNAIPQDFENRPAVEPDKAVGLARELVERLAEKGLLDKSEVLIQAPHVYFRKLGQDTGGPEGGGQPAESAPPHNMDTRVFLSRVVQGVPVSGNGLRFVFTPQGQLASLNLMWRDLEADGKKYPRRLDLEEAKKQFEGSIKVPNNARVEVSVSELVYLDPSPRDPVTFLEPGYLFVYVVKTPLEDRKDVFAVSRKLPLFVPAIEHDLAQRPSLRKERLRGLERKLEQDTRPTATPPSQEEGESAHE